MKATALYAVNDLRTEERPLPETKPGEVLVNVRAAGICGSDVNRVFKTGTYHFPTVIGHEFSGVVAGGSGKGRRVGVFPLKPCFECPNCRAGNYEMCTSYDYLGSRCDGGFQEYVTVPEWNLIDLPDNVSFEEAAMLEPTAVAFHALAQAGGVAGKSVAVIGPGTIGNILVQVARLHGAAKVIMVGRTEAKLGYALEHGADEAVNSLKEDVGEAVRMHTDGLGADIVVEGTGASASLTQAVQAVRSGGRIVLMGNPLGDVAMEKNVYWQILRRQIHLVGTWNSSFGSDRDNWKEAIAALASRKLCLTPLISHRLPFDKLREGLEIMRDPDTVSNKVMLLNNAE